MIVSVNWLRKFTDIDLPIIDLAKLIGERLVEIEEIIDLGEKYKDVIVAKVIEAAPVPDSDHLNLCKIDDGGAHRDVERDENGLIQVVCGAPNVRAGLLVAWLPPSSTVPQTFGSDEPFILGARKLRGFMSNGMIASARELDLWDEHDGILEIDVDANPGDSFAQTYELNDYLLDIENKSLTHRPDCFGLIGLAREIAAIQGKSFESPKWYTALEPILGEQLASLPEPTVKITDPLICKRYEAVVLADVNTKAESPLVVKSYLSRSGMRPINAAVDITNYLMLVTGQPLHAFDYDKLCKVSSTGAADIVVRTARNGEKMKLLDGREIEMSDGDILICAGEIPVALAGAMGGIETEIDGYTKNVMIESATFDLYRLRNTQFRHGIFSEAITRFTKGQPPELTAPVLASAIRMFIGQTGSKLASAIVDNYPDHEVDSSIEIDRDAVNKLLGSDLDSSVIDGTLKNIEYDIASEGDSFKVASPWWRTDVHLPEDVIEDIGRINGYDNIKPTLPSRDFVAIRPSSAALLKDKIRSIMSAAGANEVLTYSFVHGDLLKKVGQSPDNSYKIVNAISPDLQYYRQSLMPSLLDAAYSNQDAGFDQFALFEINKVHQKEYGVDDEQVPIEHSKLASIILSDNNTDASQYYLAKALADNIFSRLSVPVEYRPLEQNSPTESPFESKHSAGIWAKHSNSLLGVVGEFKSSVQRSFKLDGKAAGFEIDVESLVELNSDAVDYRASSRYPSAKRDITFQLKVDLPYEEIYNLVQDTLFKTDLQFDVVPVSVYQGEDKSIKNVSFRLSIASETKTLSGEEISAVMSNLVKIAEEKLRAKVI